MLSIVIPTLNEEKYLPRLLASLEQQTCKNFEIIVADAASTDTTREIARQYNCKVVPGGTISQGRNAGARHAQGEVILFLDADVTVPPAFLELLLPKFQKKKLEVASGFITPDSKKLFDKFIVAVSNWWHFAVQLFLPHASGFYIIATRDLHERIQGYNERLYITEDHDYVIRGARQGKFRYLWQPRVKFSVRRFDKEGRLALIWKCLVLEIYRVFKEVRHDIVDYEFGKHIR
jgi:glycosyltransferase involved in cell wall biosynthesis